MYELFNSLNSKDLVNIIKKGAIGVLPTDTLYGIICSALSRDSVLELYRIRSRDLDKPVIILIDSLDRVLDFGIDLSSQNRSFLESVVPASFTFLLKHNQDSRFEYLYGKSQYLSFRIPDNLELRDLLSKVGPIVAPSCNPQDLEPAKNIQQALKYFENNSKVEFYVDAGVLDNPASTIGIVENGQVEIIRQGGYKIVKN
jgi:L-threonylcarbamoyladenylate synthase